MPNWKKLIVSGSDANLNTLNIQTALTASGLNYPDTDGSSGQAITTDGSGNLSFTTISGGGSTDTGSLITTASAAGSTITFTKGDSSTFNVTIAASASSADALVTASISGTTLTFEKGDASTFNLTLPAGGGYGGESATAHHTQSIASETWSFNHGLGDRLPVITVYDNSHNVIIPNTINAVDNDNLDIVFTTARTGYATAVIMGATSSYAHTASYIESSNVDGPLGMDTITSASYALTASYGENFTISGSFNIGDYTWPTTDGTYGVEVLTTDGAGTLTWEFPKAVWETVKNVSGQTLAKGTPVHATGSGTGGNVVGVIAASASNASTMPATYILHQALDDEEEGLGIVVGFITGVNTSAFNEGDVVYVGASGGYTNVKPTGSNLIQNLGIVTKADVNGSGVVYGSGRSNDVPNIAQGYAWVGNNNQVATATATSSFFVTSGSYSHTASFVEFNNIANKPTLLSSSAQIASDISGSFTFLSESLSTRLTDDEASIDALNAATSSYLLNTTDTLTGNLTVTGTITAQEFHTEFVSASIIFQSGSTQFGNSGDDTHTFSGSLNVSGSVTARSFSGLFEGALSSSAQIATEISGAFTSTSASLASNIASNSTRLDTLEGKTLLSSSAQIATEISGAFDSVSSSIATDISNIIDGTTTVASASNALTASYALNAGAGSGFPFSGSAVITGSLLASGSVVDFTNATAISGSSFSGSFFGDGTGLSGLGYGDTKKLNQTVAATTWSFSHNMNEQFPTVTVYNDSNEVIQPTKIEGVDAQTLKLYFGVATAGTAVAVVGGTATTQEAGFNRVLTQASAATTWSFEHNLGNKYPQVIVYDSNDEYVIPGKVEAVDQNNLNIYFDIAQSGTATATVGGTSLTASYADSLVVTDTLLSTQENTDVDTGTETVATVSTTFYDGAFFDYVAKDGTNYRAGTVMAVWDGSSVQYADNSTADIGDTSGVTLAVDISGTDARLRATTTSDNWNLKAFVRAL